MSQKIEVIEIMTIISKHFLFELITFETLYQI